MLVSVTLYNWAYPRDRSLPGSDRVLLIGPATVVLEFLQILLNMLISETRVTKMMFN